MVPLIIISNDIIYSPIIEEVNRIFNRLKSKSGQNVLTSLSNSKKNILIIYYIDII